MAHIYLNRCFVVAIIILITDLIAVLCVSESSVSQLEGIVVEEQSNDPVVAIKKSSVVLNCSVISSVEHGPVLYYWKKDGVRINYKERRSRVQVLSNGSLIIRRVIHREKDTIRTDEGFYECFAKNDVGTVFGRRVHLKVARIAKEFSENPQSQTVHVGGVAYLACKIEAVPETLYVWQKNDEPLNTNHKRFRTFENSKSLLITNIEPSDAGAYKCFAAIKALLKVDASSSQLRWRYTSEAILNVTQVTTNIPLHFWKKPQRNITVLVEKSTIIDCIVTSQPQTLIKWTWNGKKLPKNTYVLEDGSVSLPRITTNMAGVYKCMVKIPGYNNKYTSLGETNIYVETAARMPPVIIERPSSLAHTIARHIIFKCEASGYPKPNITWLKNGEVVQPDGRFEYSENKKTFRIFNSAEADSGYYQCLVENSEGWTSALARLKIDQNDRAPKPPLKVYGEGLNESILVYWTLEATDDQQPIIGFSVHYREVAKQESKYSAIREANVPVLFPIQNIRLNNLKPGTNYTIYVKTFNTYGGSVDSAQIVVQTINPVPLSPSISSQVNGEMLVQWESFDEKRNGVMAKYRIYYGKVSDDNLNVLNISTNKNYYLITGLQTNTTYRIRMLAGTMNGNFPKFTDEQWPWIYHYIPAKSQSHNSIFPTVHISVINGSAAHIHWEYHGPVEIAEQIIFLRNFNQMTSARVTNCKPISRQITLTHLAPNSLHEFFLVIKSKSLATGSVSKIFHTSKSDELPNIYGTRPNINIIASLLQPGQMSLSWNYPQENDILYYKVRCETVFGLNKCDKKNEVKYIETQSNSAVLSGLDAYTWYNISVKAEKRDGSDLYSIPSLVLTREDLPSPPEHVVARVISPEEVMLQWSRPAYPNGVIKGHYISYSNDHYDPDKWLQVYHDGMMNTANIANLTKPLYYFLIRACTLAGQGQPSQIVKVFMKQHDAGFISDLHLGIIGGAAIGITCILVTVCVIFFKQRQLQKRCIADQKANPVPCPHGCVIPPPVTLPTSQPPDHNHVCKSEELWSLLTPSDKSTDNSPDASSQETNGTNTETSDLYCHVTSC